MRLSVSVPLVKGDRAGTGLRGWYGVWCVVQVFFEDYYVFKVGLGILQITSAKRCPQVWPCFGRSLFSTDFVEYDPAV